MATLSIDGTIATNKTAEKSIMQEFVQKKENPADFSNKKTVCEFFLKRLSDILHKRHIVLI